LRRQEAPRQYFFTARWVSEKKGGERRSGGAEEEERTDNFWIQSSRNPTQNFVHPVAGS